MLYSRRMLLMNAQIHLDSLVNAGKQTLVRTLRVSQNDLHALVFRNLNSRNKITVPRNENGLSDGAAQTQSHEVDRQ